MKRLYWRVNMLNKPTLIRLRLEYQKHWELIKNEASAFSDALEIPLKELEKNLNGEILNIEKTSGDLRAVYDDHVIITMAQILYRLEMEAEAKMEKLQTRNNYETPIHA